MEYKYKLGVIGGGNMANAIIGGIAAKGLIAPSEIAVSDTDCAKLAHFKELGADTFCDNAEVAANSRYLLLAVKPQMAQTVFEQIADHILSDCVISIMAGVKICRLREALGDRRYARVMPNTPAMVGEGMAAVAFSEGYDSAFVTDVFGALGKAVTISEDLFDAVTSLSGSGPAYVYMFIKGLIEGGMQGGLDYAAAKTLAVQTVRGAAKMIENSTSDIDSLIDAVCSKGGTTIQAVNFYKENKLTDVIVGGMEKCRIRSEELSSM